MRARTSIGAGLACVALVATTIVVATAPWRAGAPTLKAPAPDRDHVLEEYGRLPLAFEENRGQADPQVRYLARTGNGTLFLTDDGAVLAGADGALKLRLDGARPALVMEGLDRRTGATSYLDSPDPAEWHVDVASYGQVRYREAYPGVDLLWHGTRGALEYDFVVGPGADPGVIALVAEGADGRRLEANGDLVLSVGATEVRQHRPQVYQDIDGSRRGIEGSFVLSEGGRIGFEIGPYEAQHPLVIDPLVYSTYFGGNRIDVAHDVAVDPGGNAYVLGDSQSSDLPTTLGAFQPAHSPNLFPDVFVTKFNPAGSALVYSTFLGQGNPRDILLDGSGNVVVGGTTSSATFPVTAGAFRTSKLGNSDGFVVKLNAAGNGLIYGTYFGGDVEALAIDAAGNAYLAGSTISGDFTATPGAFQTAPAGTLYYDAFVAKLNTTGSAVTFATYLGGSDPDWLDSVAVDGAGSAYVTGNTSSRNFPTTSGAFQVANPAQQAVQAAVVAKLNPTGSALEYSSYLGGAGATVGKAVAVDQQGNAYVAGVTHGPSDFPTTANAFQPAKPNAPEGTSTGFLTKLNPAGSGAVYSTYFGGTAGSTVPAALVIDGAGNAIVAGSVQSQTLPLQNPVQNQHGGGFYDSFVAKLSPSGSSLIFGTYLGGADSDGLGGVTVDTGGAIYLVGNTQSLNFPVANAFQPQKVPAVEPGFEHDAYIAKISLTGAPSPGAPADFDGNGTTDISVFRASSGFWFVRNGVTVQFGANGDIPVPGDYDGNGTTDIAVFRPSTGFWFVRNGVTVQFGTSGDIPMPGDYDGNGTTDIAVFRPSTGFWVVRNGVTVQFGANGDIAVPGDYDGNGTTDIAVFRPSTGFWFVRNGVTVQFGANGDIPVPGDYDGNGTTDIAVFRPSTGFWFVRNGVTVQFGAGGDVPVPGDYDGNGTTDIAVFRPSSGLWFVRNGVVAQFGSSGDVPLPLPRAIGQQFFP